MNSLRNILLVEKWEGPTNQILVGSWLIWGFLTRCCECAIFVLKTNEEE